MALGAKLVANPFFNLSNAKRHLCNGNSNNNINYNYAHNVELLVVDYTSDTVKLEYNELSYNELGYSEHSVKRTWLLGLGHSYGQISRL